MKRTYFSLLLAIILPCITLAQESENKRAKDGTETKSEMLKMLNEGDAKVDDVFHFDQRFLILVEQVSKKGETEESNEMTYLGQTESMIMGIEVEQEGIQTQMIYDLKNSEVLTLMNAAGQKIGTSTPIDQKLIQQVQRDQQISASKTAEFKKTGKSKEISGYHCDEYAVTNMEDSNTKIAYWMTTESSVDWISEMSNLSGLTKSMPVLKKGMEYPEESAVIQVVTKEKSGEAVIMTVKEIQTDLNITISTEGYTFMNARGAN